MDLRLTSVEGKAIVGVGWRRKIEEGALLVASDGGTDLWRDFRDEGAGSVEELGFGQDSTSAA